MGPMPTLASTERRGEETEPSNPSATLMGGVELGGTKCVCILASGSNDIHDQVRIPTGRPDETLDAIQTVLTGWAESVGFAALGVGSFGPLDLSPTSPTYGTVVNTPKPGWNGADLLIRLRAFDVPIGFDTDVNGAALAEGRWGAGRGLESYAYVTVGTGIGVGSVVRGLTARGLGHTEAGHLRIPRMAGRTWPGVCPFHSDCVEGLASGPAIRAQSGVAAEDLPLTDPVWEEVIQALAALFHNLVLTTAPQRILLGGGVGGRHSELLPRIRAAMLESLGGYAVAPSIAEEIDAFLVAPHLGDLAGPLGAIALAQDAFEISQAAGGELSLVPFRRDPVFSRAALSREAGL